MDGSSWERDLRNGFKVMAFLIFTVGLVVGLIFGVLLWVYA